MLQPPSKTYLAKQNRNLEQNGKDITVCIAETGIRRNGEHGQNTQSIIHYAVKLCCIYVLIDDTLRIDGMNQTCVLCNQCLTIFGMEINKLRKL